MRRLATALALTLALSGCATPDPSADPDQAFTDAVRTAARWTGLRATVSVDADADVLATFGLDEVQLSSSTVTLAHHQRTELTHLEVVAAGVAAFELLAADGDIYVRSDVRNVVDELVDDRHVRAEITLALDEIELQADLAGVDYLAGAFDGNWVELDGFRPLLSLYEGMYAVRGEPTVRFDPTELADAATSALKDLLAGVDVTYAGVDEHGHRLEVTAEGSDVAASAAPVVDLLAATTLARTPLDDGTTLADALRGASGSSDVTVDVWVRDGRPVRVAFDVAQLGVDVASPVLLIVDVEEFDGRVDVPTGAARVDLFDLFGRLAGSAALTWDDRIYEDDRGGAVAVDADTELGSMLAALDYHQVLAGSYAGADERALLAAGFIPDVGFTHGVGVAADSSLAVVCVEDTSGSVRYATTGEPQDVLEEAPAGISCEPTW